MLSQRCKAKRVQESETGTDVAGISDKGKAHCLVEDPELWA